MGHNIVSLTKPFVWVVQLSSYSDNGTPTRNTSPLVHYFGCTTVTTYHQIQMYNIKISLLIYDLQSED